jgi:hypothetical protein
MAARVAAELSKEDYVEVKTAKGGFGEFSVSIDGRKVIDTSRIWFPTPSKVVAKTQSLLAKQST